MNNEFDIIEQYFNNRCDNFANSQLNKQSIIKSIGDDCAIVKPDADKYLVMSTDTLIEDVHFPCGSLPEDIAFKALAVNLSDLAAMGATPAWFTLAITLTDSIKADWLNRFSQQLHFIAQKYAIALIGGDTTRGKQLSITIQVHGFTGHTVLRSNAKPGDVIVLSGELGAAALGLKLALNDPCVDFSMLSTQHKKQALDALNRPCPEIEKGQLIAQYSQCAIDISDGLLADLGHIISQSQCAAVLQLESIPLANCMGSLKKSEALLMALTGGDDYKLCVTLPEASWNRLIADKGGEENTGFYAIGKIVKGQGIHIVDKHNLPVTEIGTTNLKNCITGYNHFGR